MLGGELTPVRGMKCHWTCGISEQKPVANEQQCNINTVSLVQLISSSKYHQDGKCQVVACVFSPSCSKVPLWNTGQVAFQVCLFLALSRDASKCLDFILMQDKRTAECVLGWRSVQIMSSTNLIYLSFSVFLLCLAKATEFTKLKWDLAIVIHPRTLAPCSASLSISHCSFLSRIATTLASFPLCFLSCFCPLLPTVPLLPLLCVPRAGVCVHQSFSLPCSSRCFWLYPATSPPISAAPPGTAAALLPTSTTPTAAGPKTVLTSSTSKQWGFDLFPLGEDFTAKHVSLAGAFPDIQPVSFSHCSYLNLFILN